MNYFKKTVSLLAIFFALVGCSKAGSDNGTPTNPNAPSNLQITATVSTDSSGNVSFSATADNAVSYVYEYGNSVVSPAGNGSVAYQYTLVGTNTYTVTVTATGSTGLTVKKSIQVTVTVKTPTGPSGVFWSEEFNVDGAPDPTKWGYDIGNNNGWGNNELEYYTNRSQNVIVQGGVLKITALKESYNGYAYTSARLLTKDKFAFTYGRVDIRAKLPAGAGTWPALWTLGSDVSTNPWPACGEMDIMEQKGNEPNKIYGTLHYPGHSGANGTGSTTTITNASSDFHIYSLDWSASSIKMYVDNNLYLTFTNSAGVPFNHDFFFILNVAMGGAFGGSVDPAFTSSTMEVDYIRVYK